MTIDPSSILLTDRVAVVTGGGAGIGRGVAAGLKAFGAKVAIWERDPQSCASAAEELGVLGITTDVRDSAAVDAALEQTVAELGPVTVLVNNAGGQFPQAAIDFTPKGWNAVIDTNLNGPWYMMQAAARKWRASSMNCRSPCCPMPRRWRHGSRADAGCGRRCQ